jgi:4-amino-4-deoxy-L-arabinose transferase-like glycosyltransferase
LGVAAFLTVACPWYILVQLRNPQFLRVFFLEHNLARFGTNMFHHPEPFWYYLPVTLLGWLPWVVFICIALIFTLKSIGDRGADSFNLFLLIWIAVFLVFFSISRSKLPGYILPAIAPGTLLLANYLREKRFTRLQPALIALQGLVIAALLLFAFMLPSILYQHKLLWTRAAVAPLVMAVIAGILVVLTLVKTGWSGLRLAGIAPAIVVLALALRFSAPAFDQTLSARSVDQALARLSPNQSLPLAVARVPRELEFGLQFYRNQPISRYELGQAPRGEHLLVMQMGSRPFIEHVLPGRQILHLADFPAQNLKLFYIGK